MPAAGVVDRVADLRVDHLDDGADHVARRAELAQLAGLLDLAQHMLEEVALGVGIGLVQAQAVHQADDLAEHGGLVDGQPGAVHEVVGCAGAQLGGEGKHLVAHEAHQGFAAEGLGPDRPAQLAARDAGDAFPGGVERVFQQPVAVEQAGVGALEHLGALLVLGVYALDEVEEEQEGELLGVADGVGVAAAKEVVADLVDGPAHVGGQGHGRGFSGGQNASERGNWSRPMARSASVKPQRA